MTQTFHLAILEREVRRIKQKHIDIINRTLMLYFKSPVAPKIPIHWVEFDVRRRDHMDYLLSLYTVGCYLSIPRHLTRMERVYAQSNNISMTRRGVALVRQLTAVSPAIFETYCDYHRENVSQTFTKIKNRVLRGECVEKVQPRPATVTPKGICYALSVSGCNYFLGHILVSEDRAIPETDIKVAVMSKESMTHTPRVTAIVLCTLTRIPDCRRIYRRFTILDTRDQGHYDFTILLNRIARNFDDIKSNLVPDRYIRYVITPAP